MQHVEICLEFAVFSRGTMHCDEGIIKPDLPAFQLETEIVFVDRDFNFIIRTCLDMPVIFPDEDQVWFIHIRIYMLPHLSGTFQ